MTPHEKSICTRTRIRTRAVHGCDGFRRRRRRPEEGTEDLSATVGPDALKAAFEEAWADVSKKLDIPKEAAEDAGKLPAETGNEVADALIDKLGLKGTDVADKIQSSMSNDFVSFLCGMYTGAPIISTGDSSTSVIAIASFAALSAVAAAAFIVMKKKDD